uniref:J domain-containing protein n=1 Tax=Dracunculus medinensis TaxID=318479 RepID=A0A0N4U2X3_DRAME
LGLKIFTYRFLATFSLFYFFEIFNIIFEDFDWNLTLGEEILNRLSQCRGQDAYIVLGLSSHCSDEDIKRYFKRQVVLLHSNEKNLVGADEALRLLSLAYEVIGMPEARVKYDMERNWVLLILYEKINRMRNTMSCKCGFRHSRLPVEGLPVNEARYCKRCRARHPAKHNDIWAESRLFGLKWVYYLCLDGVIYDITQWASCQLILIVRGVQGGRKS